MEAVFTIGGLALVVFVIVDMLKPKKKPTPPAPQQQFSMNQNPEISGRFDGDSLILARGMVSELERFSDPTSKTLKLAEMIHQQSLKNHRQNDRQSQEVQNGLNSLKSVLEVVGPLINNHPQRQIPINNHNPWEKY